MYNRPATYDADYVCKLMKCKCRHVASLFQVVQQLKMSSNPKDGEEIKFEMSEDGKDIKYSVDHEDDSGCRRETAKFSMGSNDFLATHWRTPTADPKNIVFLCHGYGEYIDFCWHELAE